MKVGDVTNRAKGWLLILLGGCLLACGDREPLAPESRDVGGLAGQILYEGPEIPAPIVIENTTDPDVCGEQHVLSQLLVSQPAGGIRNVVVALLDVPPGKTPPFGPTELVLDNRECRFQPHVAVLTRGSVVEAINSDAVLHTTHFYGATERNLSLPIQGARSRHVLDEPGFIVVKCDIHGWMQAFIRVDDHPFHAVTDPDGRFRMTGIREGSYRLLAWHETLGEQEISVRVEPGKTTPVVIRYKGAME